MLITTKDQIKRYVSLTSINIDTVSPSMRKVERRILIPFISQDVYNRLSQDESLLSSKEVQLLDLCREALVNLSYYIYFPHMIIDVGDGGATRTETAEKKAAYLGDKHRAQDKLRDDGYDALEEILEFLYENIDDFVGFRDTEIYKTLSHYLISSVKEFSRYYKGVSFLVFLNMISFMSIVEDKFKDKNALGGFYDEIKEKTQDKMLDSDWAVILELTKKAFVYMTYAETADELGIKMDDRGLYIETIKGWPGNNLKPQDHLSDGKKFELIEKCRIRASVYLSELKEYLLENHEKFPSYKAEERVNEYVFKKSENNKIIVV